MTHLYPSDREKAKQQSSAAKKTSSFFRFLTKKTSNPNVLKTARASESKKTTAIPNNAAAANKKMTTPNPIDPTKKHQQPTTDIKNAVAGLEVKKVASQTKINTTNNNEKVINCPNHQQQQLMVAKIQHLKVSTPTHPPPPASTGIHHHLSVVDYQNGGVPTAVGTIPGVHSSRSDDTGTDPIETITNSFQYALYKDDMERWTHFWNVIEEATHVKREIIAYAFAGIFSALMIWNNLGDFVCTLIGFAYPSIATFKILNPSSRRPPPSNAIKDHWFRYWSIFGFVSCIDVTFGRLFNGFPPYQMCKVSLFLAASYPEWNVSSIVHSYLVAPVVKWLSKFVNKYVLPTK